MWFGCTSCLPGHRRFKSTMSASVNYSRRNLFRGSLRDNLPLRPPWAGTDQAFTSRCTQCNQCIQSCEEKILKNGAGGFPEITFDESGCTECGQCADVCESGAIDISRPAFISKAEISDQCLAFSQVTCQSCRDVCEPRAIKFEWVNRTPVPSIDLEACTSCGFCVGVCPNHAIEVKAYV